MNAAVAPRGQVTARNDQGRSPDHPEWPRPDPRGLCGCVISFEAPTQRWLTEAVNGLLGHEALGDKEDYREGWREVPGPPCGAQADPRAPSRLVPLTRRWLPEAINGLLGHEAVGTRQHIGKVGRRFSDHPVGPRPDPRAPSRLVTLFEPPTRGWLPEAINGLLGHEALGDKGDYREGWREVPRPPCGAQAGPPGPPHLVTLFEPPMWGWLPEDINGLFGHEALGDKGAYREGWREVLRPSCGAGPPGPVSSCNLI